MYVWEKAVKIWHEPSLFQDKGVNWILNRFKQRPALSLNLQNVLQNEFTGWGVKSYSGNLRTYCLQKNVCIKPKEGKKWKYSFATNIEMFTFSVLGLIDVLFV